MIFKLSTIILVVLTFNLYSQKTIDDFPKEKSFGIALGLSNTLHSGPSYGYQLKLAYKRKVGRQLDIGFTIDRIAPKFHYFGFNPTFNFYPLIKKETYSMVQPVLGFGPSVRYATENIYDSYYGRVIRHHYLRPRILLKAGADIFVKKFFSINFAYNLIFEVPMDITSNDLTIDDPLAIANRLKIGFTYYFKN